MALFVWAASKAVFSEEPTRAALAFVVPLRAYATFLVCKVYGLCFEPVLDEFASFVKTHFLSSFRRACRHPVLGVHFHLLILWFEALLETSS